MATSSNLFVPLWWKYAKYNNSKSRNESIAALFIMTEVRGEMDLSVVLSELLAETIVNGIDPRTFLPRMTNRQKYYRRMILGEK